MTKYRDGYHELFAQIPDVLWDALRTEADEKEVSATQMLIEILRKHYRVGKEKLPPRRKGGRPPKKIG